MDALTDLSIDFFLDHSFTSSKQMARILQLGWSTRSIVWIYHKKRAADWIAEVKLMTLMQVNKIQYMPNLR